MSDLIQKRAKRRRLITRSLLAVSALLVVGFIAYRMTDREPPTQYRTAVVQRGDIESAIVALGTVDAKDYVDVGAQVSGQLLALHFDIGDEVMQGDLVAEIDPLLAQTQVDSARAQLLELSATRRQQTAQLQLAEAEAARNRALLNADAISRAEVDSSEAQLEVARAQIAQLDAQLQRTQSTLDGSLTELGYTKIYAPMSGTVVSHSAVVGQTLNANQTAPVIMRIADLNTMTVSAQVSEADVPRLRSGMPAKFTTLGNPDREWTSTVRQVLPQPEVVNDVVLYKALLDVQNADRALMPSMSAQVSFVLGERSTVLKIPAAALQLPPAMLAQADGGDEPIAAARAGRAGGPGADGLPANLPPEVRERLANMTPEQRAQMQQRFAQGGGNQGGGNFQGPPGGFQGGSAGGSIEEEDRTPQALPDYITDGDAPPRPVTVLVQAANGDVLRRNIVVGLVSRTEAEVISGLQEGERIVLGLAAGAAPAAAANGGANNGGFRGPPGGIMFRGG